MKQIIKEPILFCVGGMAYNVVEVLYRGYTHWTMFVVGGLCFVLIGLINEIFSWETALWKQMLIGGTVITIVEFVSGCVVNLLLGWNVWDYSQLPLNVLGQICVPFYFVWVVLSLVGIVLDDMIRWKCFGEDKPRYKIF
jgi:uncharacterized membrane protein